VLPIAARGGVELHQALGGVGQPTSQSLRDGFLTLPHPVVTILQQGFGFLVFHLSKQARAEKSPGVESVPKIWLDLLAHGSRFAEQFLSIDERASLDQQTPKRGEMIGEARIVGAQSLALGRYTLRKERQSLLGFLVGEVSRG
jgi:hypothetical protein